MLKYQKIARRKAIKQAGLLLGFSVTGPALAGVLNGCTAKVELNWVPKFLSAHEVALVDAASSRILPSGKTPGATDAGVSEFIDEMLQEFYPLEDQQLFQSGLAALENQSQTLHNKPFLKTSEAEQDRVLSELAAIARQQVSSTQKNSKPFFLMIKELTVLGFFTSEVGATQVLQYDDVPGGYQGCCLFGSCRGKNLGDLAINLPRRRMR